jgi:hypothetical protein
MRVVEYRALLAHWSGARRSRMEGREAKGAPVASCAGTWRRKERGENGGGVRCLAMARMRRVEQRAHITWPAVATQREIEAGEADRWASP